MVSFPVAEARLADLARRGGLLSASEVAYGAGAAVLGRFGAPGSETMAPMLVRVRFRDLIARPDSSHLALRWEAAEPGGGLFPALDADITLSPAGEHATTLALAGVYRVLPGNTHGVPDPAAVRPAAEETIRTFVTLMTAAIAAPALAARPDSGTAGAGDSWPPVAQAP